MPDEEQLTEAQLKVLSDIVKLPQPDQQRELQRFLKTLKPEQIAWLKKQQGGGGGGCIFCGIAQGKVQSKKIFENNHVIAVLDIRPAAKGHVLVIPKRHVEVSWELNDGESQCMMVVSNNISKELTEEFSAEGVNVFLAIGEIAGQRVPHVVMHVIPRMKEDTIALGWDSIEISDKELNEIQNKLIGKIILEKPIVKEKIEEIEEVSEEERIP